MPDSIRKPVLGLIQTQAPANPAVALEQAEKSIREAAAQGAHIICTQELFLTPYFCQTEDPALFDHAEPIPGPTTERLGQLAAELEIVLVASLFERREPVLFHNTAVIFDADGSLLGKYRKTHIPQDPGFEEKFYFTPGDQGYHAWPTRYGKIGILVCWDQWFPEAARLTAMAGAQILLYPTAIGWLAEEKPALGKAQHHAWETVQCGHAVANGCYLAAINRTGNEGNTEFWGQSFVADCYGQVLARAPVTDEAITLCAVDLDQVEAYRRIWPFFRDRRIDTYAPLTRRALD